MDYKPEAPQGFRNCFHRRCSPCLKMQSPGRENGAPFRDCSVFTISTLRGLPLGTLPALAPFARPEAFERSLQAVDRILSRQSDFWDHPNGTSVFRNRPFVLFVFALRRIGPHHNEILAGGKCLMAGAG